MNKTRFVKHTLAGIVLLVMEYDNAIRDYTSALRIQPGLPAVFLDRGRIYSKKGDYDLAIRDFNAAIRLQPGSALALYFRGLAKQGKGDTAGAQADMAGSKQLTANISN